MDIGVARTFLEIVKTGSFVSAAANLNLTQTAVSARIRVLETQLDRPVFIRNKTGAKLTPAGEQFLRFATTMVQVWDRARRTVGLPPGRETIVAIGVDHGLWNPLIRHWLAWMRRERPQVGISAHTGTSERLLDQVRDGTLDIAVLYAVTSRPGIVAELLFEEKLVHARTRATEAAPLSPDSHVYIDWGEEFAAGYHAAFPELPSASVSFDHGPFALDYILESGGSGYFRQSAIRKYLNEGQLELVPESPVFSYSAYVVHSTKADSGMINCIRAGLRAAAEIEYDQ